MFQNLSITFQEKQWPFVVRIQASPCSEADPVNPGWEGIRGLCGPARPSHLQTRRRKAVLVQG